MKILKALIILCSLLFLSSSFADDDYEEHYEKNHIYRSLKYLDLEKEQNSKIRDILIEYKKNYQEYLNLVYSKRLDLKKVMQSETFDKQKYIKISNEINIYFIEIEADKFNKIHEVLTPKQRVQFSYFLGEKHSD